jgi:hypothetical protein
VGIDDDAAVVFHNFTVAMVGEPSTINGQWRPSYRLSRRATRSRARADTTASTVAGSTRAGDRVSRVLDVLDDESDSDAGRF